MSSSDLPLGPDVASWQGYPDWEAVAASGAQFAITKATQGFSYINPTFAHNWHHTRANGLYRGAYHYAEPWRSANRQAEHFVETVKAQGLETGDFLALDIEEGDGDLGGWALAFCQRTEQLVGFKPLVYTAPWFASDHGFADYPELGQYGLWLASWRETFPPTIAPWEFIAFWQYTSSGSLPGIDGRIDLNRFNGAADRIPLYGLPAETTEEAVAPPKDDGEPGGHDDA